MIKKAVKAPVHRDVWTEDRWLEPESLSHDDLLLACYNSNVAADSQATKQEILNGLRELGYITVLRNQNSGEFRLMKS